MISLELINSKYAKYLEAAPESDVMLRDTTVYAKKETIKEFLLALRDDAELELDILMDVSAVDYLHWEEKEKRFEVLYNLFSLNKNHRLFVKVALDEKDTELESVAQDWPAANWYEREVWDMFGIVFKNHPNLKRILMYESFKGHPLKKDYRYNQRQPIIGPLN